MKKITTIVIFSFIITGLLFGGVSFGKNTSVFLTVPQEGKIVTPVFSLLSFRTTVLGLEAPYGIVCSEQGNLYVAEALKSKIISYTQSGEATDIILSESMMDGTEILALEMHEGDLYFTTEAKGVWKIEEANSDNPPKQIVSQDYFKSDEGPYGLTFLTRGRYAGDMVVSVFAEDNGRLVRIPAPEFNSAKNFSSTYKTGGGEGPMKTKELSTPTQLDVGPEGNVYIGDWAMGASKILKYSPKGNFIEVFTEDILRPNGLKIGPNDVLYATTAAFGETVKGALRRYTLDGTQKRIIAKPGAWAVAVCDN